MAVPLRGFWRSVPAVRKSGTVDALYDRMDQHGIAESGPRLSSDLNLPDDFTVDYLTYYGVLPLSREDGRLTVAVAGNPCAEVVEDLALLFQAEPVLEVVDRDRLDEGIRRAFAGVQSTEELIESMSDDQGAVESSALEADVRDLATQPPVVRYVNLLIKEAHEARASDIHLEAGPTGLSVRFRVDGILGAAPAPPTHLHAAVVSRTKLIADLDIAERRIPQDGRIRIRLERDELDLRVSTVPTLHGESVVMRLLDHGRGPADLAALGMSGPLRETFASVARRPNGIVLVSGPTGSGKTTTLYSALQLRDLDREKVITVEDPVEYRLAGVTQVPVNVKAGMTFAAGLRSILRQDPDVVMVGEMRDTETARIAVQASMTGHLVFSTVHTNDAVSAVTRLVDLGVEPYMVASTLRAVLAQRLVRRICPHCACSTSPSAVDLQFLQVVEHDVSIVRGEGCSLCRNTGYLGRVGLFELLIIDADMRDQITHSRDVGELRTLAMSAGMRSLRVDGRRRVLEGETTPEEVMRAVFD